ncbi:MAG: acetolactate synthase-1/2/3 large subunit [Gammaproteobacteria bacterium]|jgi:acetolactate synthase-1/2/3 large subunit
MAEYPSRTGAELLIDALKANAADRIFCIPGESYLAALDALYDRSEIDLIVCRNEGGASFMAEADGKLTGRPGVCFVTRGPGATNASSGLHVALQDSTPMILLIGQIARKDMDREAFQEIDYRRMFSEVTKWVAQIDDAARIPEYINRAYATATSGRPGPVVLALPEDMLTDLVSIDNAPGWKPVTTHPSSVDIQATAELLATAENPLVIVGGSKWSKDANQALQQIVENFHLPVVNSFRCQDYIDHADPHYAGDLGLGVNPDIHELVRSSDLLLVVGARLGEITTAGFDLINIPVPTQRLIHVHSGAEELGHIYIPYLAINSDSTPFLKGLANISPPVPASALRNEGLSKARDSYIKWTQPSESKQKMDLSRIIRTLGSMTPDNAIICNGAGNNTAWLHRYYRFHQFGTQLAPTSGTMGYGVPAAIAARLRCPDKTVVVMAGDGDFMMTGQELATAMQYQVNFTILLVNNGIYATIRMHQEKHYPNRVIGTDMVNPDFVKLAKAHNASAESIERDEDFGAALERALAYDGPSLIEIKIDPDILSPTQTVSSLRHQKA